MADIFTAANVSGLATSVTSLLVVAIVIPLAYAGFRHVSRIIRRA